MTPKPSERIQKIYQDKHVEMSNENFSSLVIMPQTVLAATFEISKILDEQHAQIAALEARVAELERAKADNQN